MLSSSSLLDSGKVLVGILVGALSIFFNQEDNQEMNNSGEILGLRTTAYAVTDIKAAKEWYTNAFETEPYFDEVYYVGFSIGGYELGLFPHDSEVTGRTENVLSYWGVRDIEKTYQYLLNNGAKAGDSPRDVGDGIMVAHVFDPWNNAVGIIYNPHFKLPEPAGAVVEWAPFKLRDGVTEDQLRSTSDKLQQDFLVNQKGFVKRELLKLADGQWVDLVYWNSQKDADYAIKNAESSEACGSYFSLMELEEGADGIKHLEVVEKY